MGICQNCGNQIRVMAREGTKYCCDICELVGTGAISKEEGERRKRDLVIHTVR